MRKKNQTSEFIKDCVADSLLDLLRTEPFETITVEEIIRKAGIGRTTFYRHFSLKSDILTYKMTRLFEKYKKENAPDGNSLMSLKGTLLFFHYCYSIKDTLLLLFNQKQETCIYEGMKREFLRDKEAANENGYADAFLVAGLFGLLTEWAENGFTDTPEYLTDQAAKFLGPLHSA